MSAVHRLSLGGDSLAVAVAVAIGLHVAVIGLVHFDVLTGRPDSVPASLDVILVEWATVEEPDEADFLAQVTQRGGGESPDLKRPAEMMPAGEQQPELEPEPVREDAQTPEFDASPAELIAYDEPAEELPSAPEQDTARTDPIDAQQLREQSLAMVRTAPDRFAEAQDFPQRQRRKFISANTREHMYASYMRAWVAKVERVGNLNYPEQARRMNLAGSLVLSVDVLANGNVDQIRVLRSSGYDILDEAAVRIVRLSAPFAPLTPEITEDVDILTITRTWQFSSRSGLH
jgi:periplasmic protein TonB